MERLFQQGQLTFIDRWSLEPEVFRELFPQYIHGGLMKYCNEWGQVRRADEVVEDPVNKNIVVMMDEMGKSCYEIAYDFNVKIDAWAKKNCPVDETDENQTSASTEQDASTGALEQDPDAIRMIVSDSNRKAKEACENWKSVRVDFIEDAADYEKLAEAHNHYQKAAAKSIKVFADYFSHVYVNGIVRYFCTAEIEKRYEWTQKAMEHLEAEKAEREQDQLKPTLKRKRSTEDEHDEAFDDELDRMLVEAWDEERKMLWSRVADRLSSQGRNVSAEKCGERFRKIWPAHSRGIMGIPKGKMEENESAAGSFNLQYRG